MLFKKRKKVNVFLAGLTILTVFQLKSMDIATKGIRNAQPTARRRPATGMLQGDLERQAAKKKQIEENIEKIKISLAPGMWFVYQAGTDEGIIVSEQALRASGLLNGFLEDMGNPDKGVLPVYVSTMQNMEYIFDLLMDYQVNANDRAGFLSRLEGAVKSFSLDQLVDTANKCMYLDVPEEIISLFVSQIDVLMQKMKFEDLLYNKALDNLNINVQEKILSPKIKLVIDCLKKKMIRVDALPKEYLVLDCRPEVFSSDGTKIILTSNNIVAVWDIQKKVVQKAMGKKFCCKHAAFSHDGRKIVTGGEKGLVLWDAKTGKEIHNFSSHIENIKAVALNRDGTKVLTSGDKNLILWDVATGKKISEFADYAEKYNVKNVALSPDGKMVVISNLFYAFGSRFCEVMLFDATTWREIHSFKEVPSAVKLVAFSPDGTTILVVGRGEKPLVLIDVKTGKYLNDLNYVKSGISDINYAAFSPNGEKIVVVDSEIGLRLFDVKSGALSNIIYNGYGIRPARFSPDGTRIVACQYYTSIITTANIITCDLLTDETSQILDSLYDGDRATALLLYRLCLASKDKITELSADEREIFNSLPEFVKDLLSSAIK